jgi:hypothetical protein
MNPPDQASPREPLAELVRRSLGLLISRRRFTLKAWGDPAWDQAVLLESGEFTVHVLRERGEKAWILVGSTVRPRKRAHLRSYLLSRLVAYLGMVEDPNREVNFADEVKWLHDYEDQVFDTALLNSEDLRIWNVNAARRMFGHQPRKR